MLTTSSAKIFMTYAVTLLLLASTASTPLIIQARKNPNFSGKWQLNHQQSDNPDEKLREAMGRRGAGLSGGGRGGFPGGGNASRFPGAGGQPSSKERQQRMQAAEIVEITHIGPELTINETGSSEIIRTRTLYTDGRSFQQNFAHDHGESKAKWMDKKLVIEFKLERGGKTSETYELSEDARQLYVTRRIENPPFSGAISIRRVYDRMN